MATFYSEAWHSAPNGGAKYRLALVCNVASQNVEANTTTINWALVMQKDRSFPGFHEYTSQTTVRLDGTIVYDWVAPNPAVAWTGWSEATLASGTRTFTHGTDGKKTIIVGGAWQRAASGWSPGSFDVSGTMVLPDIPRATTPTVEPSPASVGAAVTIKMPRAINTYTHDVTWESGALSGTIGLGLGESATWTVPDVMGEFPGQTRAPITITVVTETSGGVVLGSRSVTLQAMAPPPAPSLTQRKPGDEFDIRARQVVWDEATSEWRRGRILPTIELSMVDPYSASATCSLTMSKLSAVDFDDHSIIDIDVFDGENWRFTNHRFALSRVEGDDVDPSETYSYSGTEFVDYSLGFAYVPTDYKWTGASGEFGLTSAGNLVHYCIVKAKERGWGPRIDIAFTHLKTSFGDPWLNTNLNRTISKGTPISQALDGMVTDGYVEYRTEYHSNKAWLVLLNPGTGASFADVGASPVVNLALAKLTSAPRRGTSEKRLTRVTVIGDTTTGQGNNGTTTIRATRETTPFDENVFGHLEGWVSASGVATNAEAGRIGDNALRDNAGVVNERTFEYNAQDAAPQFYPYVVFRPGDWVLVPGKDAPEKDRISQITISKTQDSKTFTILTGDRILSGVASLAKRQSAQTGGAISGGTGMSPAPLDERIPAAPTIIDTTSTGYWTTDGNARSEITVSWAPVDTALSGSQVSVNLYEVWWREDVGGVWKFRAATADTEIDMLDWEVLKDYRLRVRARSAAGVYGEFSEDIEHTTLEPAVDLDGPVLNDLYTDGLGNIYAVWDGTLDGVPAPNRLGYIAAEVSSDGGVVYAQMGTPITAMGTIVIAPGDYGTFHVRLRAFDGLGNPGEVSDPLVVTTENPHINEIVSLSSTTQALVAPAGGAGATTPATAVITGTEANTTITTWQYSVEGAAFSATVPAGVSRTGNTVTITGSAMTAKTIAVRASDAHGASDTLTIAKLANGATGAPGTPGTPGTPGAAGVGISGTVVTYQVGPSGTAAPTGSWLSTVPATTTGQYLWTRTVTSYTNSTSTTAYAVSAHGATGAAGAPGAPGTPGSNGVGVSGTVVTYQVASSGTTAPGGTWLGSVPATTAGQYLWTRTVTSYTNSTSTTAYSVAAHGATGAAGAPGTPGTPGAAGVGVSGTVVTYQVGTSGTAAPTGTWLGSVPATTAGQFLWTRTITSYTNSTSSTAYAVAAHGATGIGVASVQSLYRAVENLAPEIAGTGTWSEVPWAAIKPLGKFAKSGVAAGYVAGTEMDVVPGQVLRACVEWSSTDPTDAVLFGLGAFKDGAWEPSGSGTTAWGPSSAGRWIGAIYSSAEPKRVKHFVVPAGVTKVQFSNYRNAGSGSLSYTMSVHVVGDPDMRVTYLATPPALNNPQNGESIMEIKNASGLSGAVGCIVGLSVKGGKPAWRLIPTSTSDNASYAVVPIPIAARGGGTLVFGNHQDAPLAGALWPYRGCPYALNPTQASPHQLANATGSREHRFTYSALTSNYAVVLPHGGLIGSGDVWWTSPGILAGDFFDYNEWGTAEPVYAADKELWRTEKVTYTDGSVTYAEPTRVTSWDGIADAYDNTVVDQVVEYAVNTSTTVAPVSGWATAQPSRTSGQVAWMRLRTEYGDGAVSYSTAVMVTGDQGNTGVGISGTVVTYQVGSSGTAAPTGTWLGSIPATTTGQFLWTRTITTMTNSTTSTSYSVAAHGATGAAGAAAYTVLLSNESHTFPGTASAAVAGSTTSRVFAYKGAAAQNATVGSITGAPTGMTTSIASNGTSAPIITITVTAALVTQSGTLSIPVTVDGITFTKNLSWAVAWSLVGAKLPLPPTALAAAPGAAWSASGYFPEAWFDLTWTAPTLDTNGDPVTIAGYDVWGKRTNEPETRFLGSVTGTAMRVPVGDGEEWAFQVEATSTTGGKSGLTGVVTSTANGTPPVAPAPGSPTLDQSVGLLRIRWSGAGMLPQIKTVYATISTSLGGTYTRAGMPLTGPGEVIVPGLAPAQYWAKIVMVDERGTLSTSAAAGPITLLPITGVTIQTSPVADTGIKLTDAALTAYDVSGNPTFILDATTGAVWIAPYDAVFEFGAFGVVAETGAATSGVQISSEGSSFNTFIHAAGIQIRNDHTPISWWEADASDASLVNFVAPRARVDNRFKLGGYEFLREAKAGGKSRLVIRYQGD